MLRDIKQALWTWRMWRAVREMEVKEDKPWQHKRFWLGMLGMVAAILGATGPEQIQAVIQDNFELIATIGASLFSLFSVSGKKKAD